MKLNKYQLKALKRLYDRLKPSEYIYIAGIKKDEIKISFLNFRRACFPEIGCRDTAVIEYNGITYGIEPDGDLHT
tara:strand:- start:127 stop:351 length:225 start_codon:yes stop_codon:yes gene_type:complete